MYGTLYAHCPLAHCLHALSQAIVRGVPGGGASFTDTDVSTFFRACIFFFLLVCYPARMPVPTANHPSPIQPSATELRRVYEACVQGARAPRLALTTGEVLNQITHTTDYEASEAYVVTREGIRQI